MMIKASCFSSKEHLRTLVYHITFIFQKPIFVNITKKDVSSLRLNINKKKDKITSRNNRRLINKYIYKQQAFYIRMEAERKNQTDKHRVQYQRSYNVPLSKYMEMSFLLYE